MKELKLSITALSDLVLIQSSNTEGYIRYLDFIPGSVLLGIVARKWEEFEDPYGVFFGGRVRFLDGHLGVGGFRSLPTPLSFHSPKGNDTLIYNYHFLTKKDYKEHIQFQQKRNDYIVPTDKFWLQIKTQPTYRQKSARDYEKGRSKDEQMFGYKSIHKGQRFYAKVLIDEDMVDPEVIENILIGTHRIGKSKSAEYALVRIDKADFKSYEGEIADGNIHYVYAMSRLALHDPNGVPTLDPVYLHPALKRENIDYEKNSIRASSYAPFNRTRKMYDAERAIIDKGSVIVLKDVDEKILKEIAQGVGGYRSEGFGEVIVDPGFLAENEFILCSMPQEKKKCREVEREDKIKSDSQRDAVHYLLKKKESLKQKSEMIERVNTFAEDNKKVFSGIKPSQWGSIRAIAKRYRNDMKEKVMEYIGRGAKQWDRRQQEALKAFLEDSDYKTVILLATEMAKLSKDER